MHIQILCPVFNFPSKEMIGYVGSVNLEMMVDRYSKGCMFSRVQDLPGRRIFLKGEENGESMGLM